MTTHLVTGGAGFIGANLVRRFVADGDRAIVVDDLSRGTLANLGALAGHPSVRFGQVDCADEAALGAFVERLGEPIDAVWHLAANSDIPAGIADPAIDLRQTFLTSFATLAVMRRFGIGRLLFASSSAIYGDFGDTEIHEAIGPLEPISNYGAMKLASEAQIRAASEAWLPQARIFRFPNVIGVPATHGVILDFVEKLAATPGRLDVLGDGTQQKAYLHVEDLVDAMLHISALEGRYLVYNIGPSDDGITVRAIAETVRDAASPGAAIAFGEGNRGWVGDVPRFRYSVDKLAATGWRPRLGSKAAVARAVAEIVEQRR